MAKTTIPLKLIFDKFLINISLFYLLLPIILFIFGWMKLGYAVIIFLLITYAIYRVSSQFQYIFLDFSRKDLKFITIVILIAIVWVVLSGVGGFGLQSWDFHGRNAIFHDLISHTWPVQYDYTSQPEMSNLIGDHGNLVYYFAFFLPAALIGKILGWFGANLFLYFWTLLGILITFFLCYRYFKRVSIWITLSFLFFSGLDFLVSVGTSGTKFPEGVSVFSFAFSSIFATNQLEWWAGNIFQYSSITTQLFNVFNQCIPAWIVTLIIFQLRDLKSIWFIYSLLFLFSPFPFIGLFPFVVFKIIQISQIKNLKFLIQKQFWIDFFNKISEKKPDWMSFQNILGGTLIFLVSSMFLLSNTGRHEFGFIWQFQKSLGTLIFIYLVFCLFEFLILSLVLLQLNREKTLILLTIGVLVTIPLFKYGKMNDFVMRASIPALLILFLISIQAVLADQKTDFKIPGSIYKLMIVVILIIGSITPFHEINRSVNAMIQYSGKPPVSDEWKSFDFGGYIDKMDSLKNFIAPNYSPITTFFFKN